MDRFGGDGGVYGFRVSSSESLQPVRVVCCRCCICYISIITKTYMWCFAIYNCGSLFQCPQQEKVQLTPSKINDGICDCCDGADENDGQTKCPDICNEVLAAEREARALLGKNFQLGSAKRKAELDAYIIARKDATVESEQINLDLDGLGKKLEKLKLQMEERKLQFLKNRLATAEERAFSIATVSTAGGSTEVAGLQGLLDALDTSQISAFIVSACQMAGEMTNSVSSKTCVPLRLAGLDAALVWEPKTYAPKTIAADNDLEMQVLSRILDHNIQNKNKRWTEPPASLVKEKEREKRRGNRRRLTEYDSGDFSKDSDDYVYDGYIAEEELNEDSNNDSPQEREPESELPVGKREEMLSQVKSHLFSNPRLTYLKHADELLDKIKKFQDIHAEAIKREKEKAKKAKRDSKIKEEEKGDEDTIDSSESEEEANQLPDGVDPLSLASLRRKLEQNQKAIDRGFDYAVSAKVLLEALFDSTSMPAKEPALRRQLLQLAIGTVNHGQLSATHVWQLLQSEAGGEYESAQAYNGDPQTCEAPWARACPPKTENIENSNGILVQFPPPAILKVAEEFCEQQSGKSLEAVCAAHASESEVPQTIPDGLFGYYVVEPRSDDDLLSQVFNDISLHDDDGDESPRSELHRLQEEDDRLNNQYKSLEKKLRELNDSIGGSDGKKFGPNGELYSLRDSCHSVEMGKYTYEVCIFGKAKQKEGGSGGTDLGKWIDPTVDEESGQRVWQWENGAKCWNGPKRSATVYVTCGLENKLLSADEPETCKYVMQMESPIACDEDFRIKHGL